jgi:hypothetical protein
MRCQRDHGPRKRIENGPPIKEPGAPLYKKAWVLISVVGFTGFTSLVNVPSPAYFEELRSDTRRIKNKFLNWYYDDESWTGFWSASTRPEGVANMVGTNLPDVDLRLETYSVNGQLRGMIAAEKICLSVPFTSFLLLDGETNGGTATITVFKYPGRKRKDFIKVKLEKNGTGMTVTPIEGNVEWLPKMTRVERDWNSGWDQRDNFRNFCTMEHHAVLQLKNESTNDGKTRPPVEEHWLD